MQAREYRSPVGPEETAAYALMCEKIEQAHKECVAKKSAAGGNPATPEPAPAVKPSACMVFDELTRCAGSRQDSDTLRAVRSVARFRALVFFRDRLFPFLLVNGADWLPLSRATQRNEPYAYEALQAFTDELLCLVDDVGAGCAGRFLQRKAEDSANDYVSDVMHAESVPYEVRKRIADDVWQAATGKAVPHV